MIKVYKVRDNQTGQVFDVPEERLSQYGLSAPTPTTIQSNQQINKQSDTITGHTLEEHASALQKAKAVGDTTAIKSIQDDYDREYQYQKDFIEPKKKITSDTQKKEDSLKAINNLINTLESHYTESGAGQIQYGPLARILGVEKGIEATTGLNEEAKLYKDAKEGFSATLKTLTGDTGVLTDQDREYLMKLLPGFSSTPKEATSKFNDLRSQVAAKFGGKTEETKFNPELKKGPTGNPLIDFLLGTAINVSKDIGTGLAAKETEKMREESYKQSEEMAQKAEMAALKTKDTEEKKRLLAISARLRELIGESTNKEIQSYSQDINKDYLGRGIEAATQIATTAEIPAIVGGVKNIITKGIPNLGKKILSQDAGQVVRNEAVNTATQAGKTINGNKIIQTIDNWAKAAKQANPAAKKTIEKYVNGAAEQFMDKNLTPQEAFDLWENARKGFTAAGTKGSSLEASYHRAIRDIVRKELDTVAKGFEQGTQMIREGLKRTELLKGIGKHAVGTGVGVASTLATLKLLDKLGIGTKK